MKFKLVATIVVLSFLLAACGGKSKCQELIDITITKMNEKVAKMPEKQRKFMAMMVKTMTANQDKMMVKCKTMTPEKIDAALKKVRAQ